MRGEPRPRTYYHTRLDTPDNISEACINLSLDICLEAAGLYDRSGGLDAFREEGKKALSAATIKSFCSVPAVPAPLREI